MNYVMMATAIKRLQSIKSLSMPRYMLSSWANCNQTSSINEWCAKWMVRCGNMWSTEIKLVHSKKILRRMVQLHQTIQSMKCQSMLRWKVLWVNGVKRVQSIKSKQKLRQIMYWWPTAIKHVQSMKIMLKWMVYDHYGGHLLVYYQTSKPVQMMKCK